MFTKWLKEHKLSDYDFKLDLFPSCEDREFWSKMYEREIVDLANKNIDFDWPITRATSFMEFSKSGDRKIMENVSRSKRNCLMYFTLAELMTDEGKYLPQIVDGIFAICEETYWGVSAHWPTSGVKNIPDARYPNVDLYAAETSMLLAWIYYLLNKKLSEFCPEILDRIEYEFDRRIIKSYLLHADNWWRGYYRRINNWNPWIISNIFNAALLIVKDRKILLECVERMMTEIDFYYKGIPDDGGCDEGPGYFAKAGASLCEFIYLLKESTNGEINFFDDEKIKNIALYPYRVYVGKGQFVNFSDGSVYGCRNDYAILYIIGRELNNDNLLYLSSELANIERENLYISQDMRRELFELKYKKEIKELKVENEDERISCFKNTEVFVKRENKWFLGIKGGHNNECHNHNDVGSYVLAYDKKFVIIDCGVGQYRRQTFSEERYNIWTMQSSYHNLPDINGCAEHEGGEYRSDYFNINDENVEIGLKSAYTWKSAVKKYDRTAVLTEKGLKITDRFEFEKHLGNVVEEHIMTTEKPNVINDKTVEIGDYIIRFNTGKAEYEAIDITYDKVLYSGWKQDNVYRINLHAKDKKTIEYSIERKEENV